MPQRLYDTPRWNWLRERVLRRDGNRCAVGRLLGGDCHPTLHVHHVVPVSDGGSPWNIENLVTVCASHHPELEALRRRLRADPPRCSHFHPYPEGRRACERRLQERRVAA